MISESNTLAAIEVVARNSPADGVPQKPEAWLLHAACNGIIDAAGHDPVQKKSQKFLQQIADTVQLAKALGKNFSDERDDRTFR